MPSACLDVCVHRSSGGRGHGARDADLPEVCVATFDCEVLMKSIADVRLEASVGFILRKTSRSSSSNGKNIVVKLDFRLTEGQAAVPGLGGLLGEGVRRGQRNPQPDGQWEQRCFHLHTVSPPQVVPRAGSLGGCSYYPAKQMLIINSAN